MAKAPRDRAAVGPFEPEFLAYLEHRAGELVELIAADDRKYGRLNPLHEACLLYTSDAADERSSVDLGGRRSIKKKQTHNTTVSVVTTKNPNEETTICRGTE
mgnify:CR=1 FL=1